MIFSEIGDHTILTRGDIIFAQVEGTILCASVVETSAIRFPKRGPATFFMTKDGVELASITVEHPDLGGL